jgi:hypothetical protein
VPLSESMLQSFGGLTLPAVEDADTDTLASLDPARDLLLAFFAAVINSEFGAAWSAIVNMSQVGHRLDATSPVQSTMPAEPTAERLQQVKKGFPLLALNRNGSGQFEDFSLEQDKLTQSWTLHYIIGPLDIIDHRKVSDICQAIAKTLRLAVRQRRHRSYQDGALQFFGDTCSLASVDLVGFEGPGAGQYGGDSPLYLVTEYEIKTTELSGYVDGSEESNLEAADLRLHLGSDEGILPDAVLWSSDAQPGDEPNPQ